MATEGALEVEFLKSPGTRRLSLVRYESTEGKELLNLQHADPHGEEREGVACR